MSELKNYRLEIKATEKEFHLQKLETVDQHQPFNSTEAIEPVPTGVIGYWIDIVGQDCQVLFRKYLNNLPLNLPHSWSQWGKRKRQKAHYVIEVPVINSAKWVRLYEQRIPAPGQHTTERQKHFQFPVHNQAALTSF
jgi:hypothetical protein